MKREKQKIIIYSILLSTFFLWIGTKSSPIYAMNDWVDANAFFTMGKGWVHGLVPFRDLFEQKGPILYLIYGIGYLLSPKSFFGIYLLEIASMTVFLYYFYKILKLYQYEKGFYVASPLVLAVILTMASFVQGGSVEEFTLPLFAISLYHFLFLLKEKQYLKTNRKLYYTEGIIVALVLWMKFILLGFWIGFVFLLFMFLVKEKKGKLLLEIIVCYLLGILTITVPIILYFASQHALSDLWNTYFYINIFLYPGKKTISLFARMKQLVKLFKSNIKIHVIYACSLLFGTYFVLRDKVIFKKGLKLTFFVLILFTFFFNYIGLKSYRYYFFVMAPFVLFFGLWIAKLAIKIKFPTRYLVILVIPTFWFFVYTFGPNTYFLKYQEEDLAQFQFAKIMNQEPHPTLLYYGKVDGGFYTIANILPTEKYFENVNVDYKMFPESKDSQNEAIQKKKTKFVIMRLTASQEKAEVPYLEENYRLVEKVYQEYEHTEYQYLLYQVKEDL